MDWKIGLVQPDSLQILPRMFTAGSDGLFEDGPGLELDGTAREGSAAAVSFFLQALHFQSFGMFLVRGQRNSKCKNDTRTWGRSEACHVAYRSAHGIF